MITTQELASQRTKMASERTRLATERTLVAWVRTGLATTLGFILAVFLTTLESGNNR